MSWLKGMPKYSSKPCFVGKNIHYRCGERGVRLSIVAFHGLRGQIINKALTHKAGTLEKEKAFVRGTLKAKISDAVFVAFYAEPFFPRGDPSTPTDLLSPSDGGLGSTHRIAASPPPCGPSPTPSAQTRVHLQLCRASCIRPSRRRLQASRLRPSSVLRHSSPD